MTGAVQMGEVLARFVQQFNHVPELPRMAAGWERHIVIRARDAGWAAGLRVAGGRIAIEPPAASPEITLEGPADTLAGIFRGEQSPTEPYLDGTLTVRSSEEDMMKLDVFTLMVWGV